MERIVRFSPYTHERPVGLISYFILKTDWRGAVFTTRGSFSRAAKAHLSSASDFWRTLADFECSLEFWRQDPIPRREARYWSFPCRWGQLPLQEELGSDVFSLRLGTIKQKEQLLRALLTKGDRIFWVCFEAFYSKIFGEAKKSGGDSMIEYTMLLVGGLTGQRTFRFTYHIAGEPPEEFEVVLRTKDANQEIQLTYRLEGIRRASFYEEGTMVAHYRETHVEYIAPPRPSESGPYKRVIEVR